MQNYWYNKSQPHLISVATLPCELDNGHVLQSAKSYWQLQLNQTGLAVCVQVFDWSTTVRKVAVIAENAMSKSKNSAGNDRRRPWRTLRDNDATVAQKLQWQRDPA